MTDRAEEIAREVLTEIHRKEDERFDKWVDDGQRGECGYVLREVWLGEMAAALRAYGDERAKAALEDERELLFSPMTTGGRAIRALKEPKP